MWVNLWRYLNFLTIFSTRCTAEFVRTFARSNGRTALRMAAIRRPRSFTSFKTTQKVASWTRRLWITLFLGVFRKFRRCCHRERTPGRVDFRTDSLATCANGKPPILACLHLVHRWSMNACRRKRIRWTFAFGVHTFNVWILYSQCSRQFCLLITKKFALNYFFCIFKVMRVDTVGIAIV